MFSPYGERSVGLCTDNNPDGVDTALTKTLPPLNPAKVVGPKHSVLGPCLHSGLNGVYRPFVGADLCDQNRWDELPTTTVARSFIVRRLKNSLG